MKTLAAAVLALCAPVAVGTRRRPPGSAAGDAGSPQDKLALDTARLRCFLAHQWNSSGGALNGAEIHGGLGAKLRSGRPGLVAGGNQTSQHEKLVLDAMHLWRFWAHREPNSKGIPSSEEIYGALGAEEPGGPGSPPKAPKGADPPSKSKAPSKTSPCSGAGISDFPSEEEMAAAPNGEIPYEGSGCESYCKEMRKEGMPNSELCMLPPCQKCNGCSKAIAAKAPFLQVGLINVGGVKPLIAMVQNFKFSEPFLKVPIVVITANARGGQPAHIRVKDVTKEGFSAVITEPFGQDGPHADQDVPYMAVEPGVHTLNGGKLEAGSVSTKNEVQSWRCKHKGVLQRWENLKFKTKFKKPPAFVTTIQTMANEKNGVPRKPSDPFLAPATKSLTAQGVQVALERAELGKTGRLKAEETIGYLAMTEGSGQVELKRGNFVSYAAVLSKDLVVGWGGRNHKPNTKYIKFGRDLGAKPLVVASQASRDGGDGGWARVVKVRRKGAWVTIDEDQGCDRERDHTTEAVAMIAWSGPCHV